MTTHGLHELAAGVFVYEVPGPIVVNAGIVLGDAAACVIDTGSVESDARLILAAVARLSPHPVRYVINTHHHGDHTFGNWWFRPALLIGHHACRLRLVGDAGQTHRDVLAQFAPMAREQIAAVPIAPPGVTFADQLRLHLGDHTLRLNYFGRAHTDNDITIAVEQPRICFAGDVIEESGPPMTFEAYPAEWGPTLRHLEATPEERFVPGHGRQVDRAFVAWQRAGFETLAAACAEAGSEDRALRAIPTAARDVLGHHAETAVRRYFTTRRAAPPAR